MIKSLLYFFGILLLLGNTKSVVFEEWPINLDESVFETWNHPFCQNNCIVQCISADVFGLFSGARVFKQYTTLPPHEDLIVKFRLYQNDFWESHERFMVDLDGQRLLTVDKPDLPIAFQTCGLSQRDLVRDATLTFTSHTSPRLRIDFFDDLDQSVTNESWAISNFQLILENVPTDVSPPSPTPSEPEPVGMDVCEDLDELNQVDFNVSPSISSRGVEILFEIKQEDFVGFEDNCLDIRIRLEGKNLPRFDGERESSDSFKIDGNLVYFKIDYGDIDEKYGCRILDDEKDILMQQCSLEIQFKVGSTVKNFDLGAQLSLITSKLARRRRVLEEVSEVENQYKLIGEADSRKP